MMRASFDAQRGPQGALLIGNPEEVVEKIIRAQQSAWRHLPDHLYDEPRLITSHEAHASYRINSYAYRPCTSRRTWWKWWEGWWLRWRKTRICCLLVWNHTVFPGSSSMKLLHIKNLIKNYPSRKASSWTWAWFEKNSCICTLTNVLLWYILIESRYQQIK